LNLRYIDYRYVRRKSETQASCESESRDHLLTTKVRTYEGQKRFQNQHRTCVVKHFPSTTNLPHLGCLTYLVGVQDTTINIVFSVTYYLELQTSNNNKFNIQCRTIRRECELVSAHLLKDCLGARWGLLPILQWVSYWFFDH
jgi:hypothetical protein